MPDIVLAQIGERTWLVNGEVFIDDLLANTLRDDVTIDFVACESEKEVLALWYANFPDPDQAPPPWMIHPAIAARCRNVPSGDGIYAIAFGPWSAMRDADADARLAAAVAEAERFGDAPIVLTSYADPNGPAMAAEMANLRSGLVKGDMVARGIDAARIIVSREPVEAGDAAMADRIDIRIVLV
jgi:hypothetical protein